MSRFTNPKSPRATFAPNADPSDTFQPANPEPPAIQPSPALNAGDVLRLKLQNIGLAPAASDDTPPTDPVFLSSDIEDPDQSVTTFETNTAETGITQMAASSDYIKTLGYGGGWASIYNRFTYTFDETEIEYKNDNKHWEYTGVGFAYAKHYFYDTIYGNALDNVITGNGDTGRYHEHWSGWNDTIYGGDGNDIIRGLEGHDSLLGENGDDFLFGGKGNDFLDGGAGNDVLYGGEGNDTINGGDGDDWLFSGPLNEGSSNVMTGGGGADTFVIGKIPEPQTITNDMDWGAWGSDFALGLSDAAGLESRIIDFAFSSFAPHVKLATKIVPVVVDAIKAAFGGANAEVIEVPPPVANYTQITDFNPLEDVVIVPLNPDGPLNILLSLDTTSESALTIKNIKEDGTIQLLATLSWAAVEDIYGVDSGMVSLSTAAQNAFLQMLIQSAMIITEDGVTLGLTEALDLQVDPSFLAGLGTGSFLIFGAYTGHTIEGSAEQLYSFGTNYDDVISGYSLSATDGTSFSPETSGDDELRGFGGDDLLIGGSGKDRIYGGDGSDTSSYQHATRGVVIDMMNIEEDANGLHVHVDETGFDATDWHKLYDIENIIGSDHDDVIHGDDNDNIIVSGHGDDELMGRGGADIFTLSSGENTILDFNSDDGDTIRISIEDYGVLSTDELTYVGPNADGTAFIKIAATGVTVAILENMAGKSFVMNRDVSVTSPTKDTGTSGDDIFVSVSDNMSYFGLAGSDTIDYSGAADGVSVDLSKTKSDKWGTYSEADLGPNTDRLYSIEHITGSGFDDLIIGDAGDNVLTSGAGNDTLDGGAGADTYVLNGGSNQIHFSLDDDKLVIDGDAYSVSSEDDLMMAIFIDLEREYRSVHIISEETNEIIADIVMDRYLPSISVFEDSLQLEII